MADIVTNRDLYLAVSQLIAQHRESMRSLEEYLRALWDVAHHDHEQTVLAPGSFFGVLAEAFTVEPSAFDDELWRSTAAELYALDLAETPGFQGWEYRVVRQIIDLREMAEGGQLGNEMRYFGINAPRGSRWYNFDPCTFLECGMAGTFGGWQPGDDTGRDYVPGEVAVMGPDGQITSRDPREIDDPIGVLQAISWESFRDFLGEGQWYE